MLDGTFQDEHGDYPAGSYFRNPPGTAHSPAAAGGCTIFVRLWQFRQDDRLQVNRQPGEGQALPPRPGAISARELFADAAEQVWIEEWTPGASVSIDNAKGLEFLLLAGDARIDGQDCAPQSWGRLPAGHSLSATVGPAGASIWIKAAPLLHADVLPLPE